MSITQAQRSEVSGAVCCGLVMRGGGALQPIRAQSEVINRLVGFTTRDFTKRSTRLKKKCILVFATANPALGKALVVNGRFGEASSGLRSAPDVAQLRSCRREKQASPLRSSTINNSRASFWRRSGLNHNSPADGTYLFPSGSKNQHK